MRVISLLCSLLLLVACSSNSSSGTSIPEEAESKYSQGLPATDFAVDETSKSAPAPAPESGYSRQFVLEEEVIASARDNSASLARDAGEFKAPTENELAAVGRDSTKRDSATPESLPPLDKTFTLQLAAVKDMQQAIEYAKRYNIDPDQAGVAQILSKGQLWYVLAYGVYTSREAADLAKSELQARGVPEPWIRSLAALEALNKEATESGY